jgi:starch phosphorylase
MKEALECWPEDLFQRLLPRIYQITKEIDNRFRAFVWNMTGNSDTVERMAIISNGVVRMANLCVAGSHCVNGVSALHSDILKDTVFSDFYALTPSKFTNVTNGIAHRRWLCQSNPELAKLIKEHIGDGYVLDASELERLKAFKRDKEVLAKIAEVKYKNKVDFSNYIKKTTGVSLDPESIFDVQVKRLHEYKRQHLNALNIVAEYLRIKENPNGDYTPHTYIFGAKAAAGYFMAKKIISFICALSEMINNDPDVNKYLKVFYVEDYNVTKAERLIPTADISEQISLAGTEASGTSNMKFMINGAVTIGTLDGANVEIHDAVGDDNIVIFGMTTPEVEQLKHRGYNPQTYYDNNEEIRKVLDFLNRNGVNGQFFPEITSNILYNDPYMVLADFQDYRNAQQKIVELWNNKKKFSQMSLINTASAGIFAADRSIKEYAENIWHTKSAFKK